MKGVERTKCRQEIHFGRQVLYLLIKIDIGKIKVLRLSIKTDVRCAEQAIRVDFVTFGGRSFCVLILLDGD